MYPFIDRPLAETTDGCRFLVWSMRCWVTAAGECACPAQIVAPSFANLNLLSGLQPFLRTMALLNRHGLQQMKFCSTQCRTISEHEAILLGIACLMADGRGSEAQASLVLLVEEEAVAPMFTALDALVRAMEAAALAPAWPATPARLAR